MITCISVSYTHLAHGIHGPYAPRPALKAAVRGRNMEQETYALGPVSYTHLAQTAGREGGSIRLALDELFAGEFHDDAAVCRRRNEAVVLLSLIHI